MEADPSSRMSVPLEIEAVAADPVQASERRVDGEIVSPFGGLHWRLS
jgi:hypothetical protein